MLLCVLKVDRKENHWINCICKCWLLCYCAIGLCVVTVITLTSCHYDDIILSDCPEPHLHIYRYLKDNVNGKTNLEDLQDEVRHHRAQARIVDMLTVSKVYFRITMDSR